eukprot:g1193.t1
MYEQRKYEHKAGFAFTAGFVLLALHDAVQLVFETIEQHSITKDRTLNQQDDTEGYSRLALAIIETAGLLLMLTYTSLDVNQYLSQNQQRLVLLLLVWATVNILQAVVCFMYAVGYWYINTLSLLPFLYIAVRYKPVTNQTSGFPKITVLVVWVLALGSIVDGSYVLHNGLHHSTPHKDPAHDDPAHQDPGRHGSAAISVPWPVIICWCVLAPSLMGYAYWRSRRAHESHTIAAFTSIYVYLVFQGLGLLSREMWHHFVIEPHRPRHDDQTAVDRTSYWLAGPIYLVPSLAMIVFRSQWLRSAALRALTSRQQEPTLRAASGLSSADSLDRGNLIEVEDAILHSLDYNEVVLTTSEDDYSLLHTGVMNDHLDAMQRLLQTAAVDVNKRTPKHGHTPLFLAAKLGHVHAAVMLLEHSADVNSLSDDGQSPLIAAAVEGHDEMVALLEANGADKSREWMSMTAAEVIRQSLGRRKRPTKLRGVSTTSTQRPLLPGQDGYDTDEDLLDSLDSSFSSVKSGRHSSKSRTSASAGRRRRLLGQRQLDGSLKAPKSRQHASRKRGGPARKLRHQKEQQEDGDSEASDPFDSEVNSAMFDSALFDSALFDSASTSTATRSHFVLGEEGDSDEATADLDSATTSAFDSTTMTTTTQSYFVGEDTQSQSVLAEERHSDEPTADWLLDSESTADSATTTTRTTQSHFVGEDTQSQSVLAEERHSAATSDLFDSVATSTNTQSQFVLGDSGGLYDERTVFS